jgi:carbon-monoxide dehydrogenase large subunit
VTAPASARLFGASVKRVEDPRLLRGEGRYLADLERPGMLHAAFLRSPHAHARIVGMNLEPARALAGVRLVLDGQAVAALAKPFRIPIRTEGYRPTDYPQLAVGKVRFVGEPVALVAADDPYLARDALELIEVEYKPLEAVHDPRQAIESGAPTLHEEAPGNVLFERRFTAGDVNEAFAGAAITVEVSIRNGRSTGLAMENRGVLAEPDPDSGRLRVWSSTQVPFEVRHALATVLGIDETLLSVTAPDVGGGFGTKALVYPEEMVVPLAARLLGRPVRWVGDRLEDLQASTHARGQVVRAELAATSEGLITGLRAEVLCDHGAYGGYPYGPVLEAAGTPSLLPGPYRVPSFAFRSRAVATNKAPEGAYRGVGMVIAALVTERLMDELARRLGLDSAEARRRNLIPSDSFPYRTVSGMLYDSGSFRESLEAALQAADYARLRREQAEARAAGRLVGIGIGTYVEFTGMGSSVFRGRGMELVDGRESARVIAEPDGGVRVILSFPSQGQGHATTFAQVVAVELDLPLERVTVRDTDTAELSLGTGTFGSRGAVLGAGAARLACGDLKERAFRLAARPLEASPDDLVFERGGVAVRGAPERRVELAELAALADGTLDVRREYDPPGATYANATHLCMLEVDPETGLVAILRYVVAEDCGKLINPTIVDGQVHGAVAQGIGGALYEELRYDESGQLVTSSLLDYLAPGCADMPAIEIRHLESPAPHSLQGIKGIGEGGTIGAVPAVANAVADALGVAVEELPLTPERIRGLLRCGGRWRR